MGLYSEFKTFVARGNVVDLAVGVIMGGAFGKIVNSLVADVLMPPIGYIVGGKKFTDLKFTLPQIPDPLKLNGVGMLEPATVNIGNFLQSTFDFLIIAICVFMMIKAINALKLEIKPPPPPVTLTPTEELLIEIRDLLKSRSAN